MYYVSVTRFSYKYPIFTKNIIINSTTVRGTPRIFVMIDLNVLKLSIHSPKMYFKGNNSNFKMTKMLALCLSMI